MDIVSLINESGSEAIYAVKNNVSPRGEVSDEDHRRQCVLSRAYKKLYGQRAKLVRATD
jgi:hypothetical protein